MAPGNLKRSRVLDALNCTNSQRIVRTPQHLAVPPQAGDQTCINYSRPSNPAMSAIALTILASMPSLPPDEPATTAPRPNTPGWKIIQTRKILKKIILKLDWRDLVTASRVSRRWLLTMGLSAVIQLHMLVLASLLILKEEERERIDAMRMVLVARAQGMQVKVNGVVIS